MSTLNKLLFYRRLKKTSLNYHHLPLDLMLRLTLKMPRKPASENVVCLSRLLNILANFSNLLLQTGKHVNFDDLGPHCLQKRLKITSR